MSDQANPPEAEIDQNVDQEGVHPTEQDAPDVEAADANEANEAEIHTLIVAMQAENSDLKDRVLRSAAEMENLRKRTQREVSDARTYAIADFARDMLAATDSLERALLSIPQAERDAADANMKSLIEGIEMTEREMQRLMQKNGVRPILAEGEKFNPHKHQAMFEVPNDLVPEGTIVQVMQAGFEIGNRVLRPAMVGVAKGGPKAGKTPEAASTSTIDMTINPETERPEDFDADDDGIHIDREV